VIEVKSVATYDGNLSYNNEARRNREYAGAQFNSFLEHTGGDVEDVRTNTGVESSEREENALITRMEIITYDFFGKRLNSERFYGRTVNLVI